MRGESEREAWLEVQRLRWSSPKCGKRYSWCEEACGRCGAGLYSCEDEEKDILESERRGKDLQAGARG